MLDLRPLRRLAADLRENGRDDDAQALIAHVAACEHLIGMLTHAQLMLIGGAPRRTVTALLNG